MVCQFTCILFTIPFKFRNLGHELGRHIHRDGQLAVERFHAAVNFLRQGLRFAGCGGRILQEQRQVEVGFAFAVFPAQWRNGNHRLALQQDRQVIKQHRHRLLLVRLRVLLQGGIGQQSLALFAVFLTEFVPRLAVNVADFQRQLTGTQILILYFQAFQAVIQLGVDAFTVFGDVRLTVQIHAFQHRHLFAFDRNGDLIEAQFLVADTLIKIGHTAIAAGFQIVEGKLHLLVIFID